MHAKLLLPIIALTWPKQDCCTAFLSRLLLTPVLRRAVPGLQKSLKNRC
jgi:hypothetical protein